MIALVAPSVLIILGAMIILVKYLLLRFIGGWLRVTIIISRPDGAKAIAAENMVLRK